MDNAVDIDSLLAEGASKYGSSSGVSNHRADDADVDVDSLISEGASKYGEPDLSKPRGTLAEMGRQVGAGAAVDIPEMAGKAIQAATDEGGTANQIGKSLRESAEARAPEWEPDLRGKNEVQKALVHGARAIAPSVAPQVLNVVPVVGPALSTGATAALFGGAQFQDTYEKLISEGASPEEAKEAAMSTAVAQGGGEAIANRLTAGVLGAGKSVAAKTVGEMTGQIAKNATWKEAGKQFGKAYLADIVGEPATEIAQDTATEAIERAYGAKPSAEYGDIAYQSGTAALAMAAMLGIPGAGGHYANKKLAERKSALIEASLNDPNTPEQTRIATVNGIHQLAKRQGIEDADQWRDSAIADVMAGRPVGSVQRQQPVEQPEVEQPAPEVEQPAPEVEQPAPEVFAIPESANEENKYYIDDDTLTRGRSFVDGFKAKIATGGTASVVSNNLRKAAQTFGVYNPEMTPNEMLDALDSRISAIEQDRAAKADTRTPGQKVADDIRDAGPFSAVVASAPEAIDEALQAQTQALEAEEPAYIDQTTGEVLTGEKPQEEDFYSPEALGQMDEPTLKALLGNLSGQRLAAVNDELLRRKENAEQITPAGPLDVGGSAQSGIREESRDTAVSGPGISSGGQEIGNIQPEASETPIPQTEVTDDQSQNPTAQETTAEIPQEEITEAGHPKYVKARSLAEAADITERNKAAIPEEQVRDGDYQRGFADFDGLHIAIENKAGSFRSGKDKSGKEWRQQMHSHYGEIGVRDGNGDLITGADGDLVDVFVNPNPKITKSPKVFVIDQVNKDGSFDEHKAVMGYPSAAKAKEAYLTNYEKGWTGLGAITEMTMPEFKNWLVNEDPKVAVSQALQKSPAERLESAKALLLQAVPNGDIDSLRGPDDLLRPQSAIGANKPKPAVKPETTIDLFAGSEAEQDALARKQQLSDYERSKAAKRAGPVESELFTDITAQKDIEDIFEDLLPGKSSEVKSAAEKALSENPNAERLKYVEDNWLDLLAELEDSKKVDIKC